MFPGSPKGGNVNIRSKVATGEQQRESQGRQKFNISLIISSLQSGRDRSATLKWKCTRSEPLPPSTGWRTALINIQNGTWNSATRETKDIPYRLFHGRNLPILSRRDALSRPPLSLSLSFSLIDLVFRQLRVSLSLVSFSSPSLSFCFFSSSRRARNRHYRDPSEKKRQKRERYVFQRWMNLHSWPMLPSYFCIMKFEKGSILFRGVWEEESKDRRLFIINIFNQIVFFTRGRIIIFDILWNYTISIDFLLSRKKWLVKKGVV